MDVCSLDGDSDGTVAVKTVRFAESGLRPSRHGDEQKSADCVGMFHIGCKNTTKGRKKGFSLATNLLYET
jgi:hypothetical protein